MNYLLSRIFTLFIVFQFIFFSLDVCAQELQSAGKKKIKTASKLVKKGNFNAANDIYTQLLSEYPNNDIVLWASAECAERINDFSSALANYNSLVMLYETQLEDLMFSSGKKDKKLRTEISKKKQKAKNKVKSCESMIKEGAQRNNMLNDNDKKERPETNKTNLKNTAIGTQSTNQSSQDNSSTTDNNVNLNNNNEVYVEKTETGDSNSSENQFYNEKGLDISEVDFSIIPPLRIPDKGVLTDFIGLQTRGKHDQIEEIQHYIDVYFQQLKDQGRHTSSDYNDIINLSHNWVKKNTLMQYGWFEDLKTKEGIYRSIVDQFNTYTRDKKRLENDLQIQYNDSLGIVQKIRINKDDSIRLHEIYDNALTEELKSKLSTIPNSIVLCGRIKQDIKTTEHTKLLMNAMTDIAIKQVNAYNILSYRHSENDKLEELYELTTEGIAQTADKYYKNLRVTDAQNVIIYDYEIYRIEVFPFNENAKMSSMPSNSKSKDSENFLNSDLNIYSIRINNNKLEFNELIDKNGLVVRGDVTNSQNHKFGPDVLKFVTMISNSSEEFNAQYNNKIKEAINKYESERSKYKGQITKIGRANNQLYIELKLNHLKTDSIRQQLSGLSIEHENLMKEAYQDSKQDYVNHYQKKYQSVNQLAVLNAEQISTGGFEEGFQNLVAECYYSIKENISKKYNKTTIFKEVQFGTENMGLEAFETTYKPVIDSFQILSLNIYSIANSHENFLALNLAFKIRWMMEGTAALAPSNLLPISDDEIAIAEQPGESKIEQELHYSKPQISEIQSKPKVEDNINSWKLYSNEFVSFYSYQSSSNNTKWRLPNYNELLQILNNEENQAKLLDNLKTIIDEYELTSISFLSSNTSYDIDNLEINLGVQFDLSTVTCSKKEVGMGNSVFIIQVSN